MIRQGYEQSAHLYDLFDRKPNIAFFAAIAQRAGTVLDVGAGTGRLALPMAAAGAEVWCVEPSPAMRAMLLKKLSAWPGLAEKIRILRGDASGFDAGRSFPAAVLSGVFDHLLDGSERERALRNLARHLEPGGALAFDVFLGMMGDRPLSLEGIERLGNHEYRRFTGARRRKDGTLETTQVFEIYQAGTLTERLTEHSQVGIVKRVEIAELLRRTGFRIVHEWQDYGHEPHRDGDPLLVVEAVRETDGGARPSVSGGGGADAG